MKAKKFMMALDPKIYRELRARAKKTGVNIQELLRVRAIPEFLYGPVTFSNKTIAKWERMGLLKNGSSRKVSGTRDLPQNP